VTWNLEVDIDLAGESFELVKALTEFFVEDIEDIQFKVARQQDFKEEILAKENLIWQSETLLQLQSLFHQQWSADTSLGVGLGLHGYGDFDYSPYPEIYFFGSQHPMRTEYRTRRISEATLDFGNHKAYQGRNKLPVSQRCLDTVLVTQALEYLCKQTQPKNLYLLNEECVSIPWNYHFIFHNHPMGYIEDVAEIVRFMLYGGDERYRDARRDYEPGLSDYAPMMFCKRIPEHIDALKRFIAYHSERIKSQGLPKTFSQEQLESAVLQVFENEKPGEKPLFDFFFVDEGLGVYSKPLLHYCEELYLALIEQLSAVS
jgi:hypothetical protein